MKEQMDEKYFFVVPQKSIIRDGDKYLIIKRSPNAHTYPEHWDFPGGRLESGEDIQEGLEREVLEETGLKVDVKKPVFIFQEILNGHPTVFIVHDCKKLSDEVKISHEHTDFKWATKEEILKLKIENFLRAFLDKS